MNHWVPHDRRACIAPRLSWGFSHCATDFAENSSIHATLLCYGSVAMRATFFAVALFVASIHALSAQSCPKENSNGPNIDSAPQTLSGKLVYHDDLRQWFGLQLDAAVCGEKEIQLIQSDEASEVKPIEVFRGCGVTVHGTLGIPGTGYYSAEIYQNVDKIDSAPDCVRQPAFPDYSKTKPDPSIRSYHVSIRLDYEPTGHINVTARTGKRILTPWQVYANYFLTGLFAFYGTCADDYTLRGVHGTPEAKPWTLDNQVLMDPESAAAKHIHLITLDYTCRRD